jgi:lipopolysaccharide biosynthesis regulator YciM
VLELDIPWLLVALPVAFGLGWLASRFDLRQVQREARDAPRAYFKGLNLLLNEQQDKAIDAFIEAVQNDPDTAELHFALGNLFRRRGEFERAIRVHEHLLQRGDLKPADRDRAQYALAQDFMKAGLFDRAEAAYRALAGSAFASEALLALLSLYERSRDWAQAVEVAGRLEASGTASFAPRRAHYECERALEADARGQGEAAAAALARARQAAPDAPRPLLLTAQRQRAAGDTTGALASWELLRARHPASFNLVAEAYAQAAIDSGRTDAARGALEEALRAVPSSTLLQALVQLDTATGQDSLPRLRQHLQQHPTLSAALLLLQQPPERWGEDGLQAARQAVAQAARPLQRYRCAACGFEAQHYFWQCPGCLSWDSFPPRHIDAL